MTTAALPDTSPLPWSELTESGFALDSAHHLRSFTERSRAHPRLSQTA